MHLNLYVIEYKYKGVNLGINLKSVTVIVDSTSFDKLALNWFTIDLRVYNIVKDNIDYKTLTNNSDYNSTVH